MIHQTVQHLRIPFSEAEISLENLEELGRLWKMELEGVYEHGQPPPAAATLLDNIVTEERMEANEIPQVDGMDGNSSSDESYVPPSGLGSDSSNTDSDNDDLISVPDLDGDGGGGGSDLDVKATVKEFQKQDLVPVINAVAKNFKASTKGIKMEVKWILFSKQIIHDPYFNIEIRCNSGRRRFALMMKCLTLRMTFGTQTIESLVL